MLSSTKAEPQNVTEAAKNTSEQKKTEDEGAEDDDGPEYIPKRKAKNPMMVIGYAWYELYSIVEYLFFGLLSSIYL